MKSVMKKFPGREQQIKLIWKLIPENNNERVYSSFINLFGPSGTGKTAIIRHVLHLKKKRFIFINCYECCNLRQLCTKILRDLFKKNEEYFGRINSVLDFVTCLRKAGPLSLRINFIVLKNCEYLGTSVFELFMYLQKFLQCEGWNFCIIFIIDQFVNTLVKGYSYTLHFPQYKKEQLHDILLLKRPNYPQELYYSFLQAFLPSVYHSERNLNILIRLVDFLFPIYKEPVDQGKFLMNDVSNLFRNIRPYLQGSITDVFLLRNRFISDNCEKVTNSLDLPYTTKYLLLAAYLASFIPSKYDRKFFCKKSFKKKQKKFSASTPHAEITSLVAPKSFPIDRLLAIYFAIIHEHSNVSANLLSQLTSLVELKLVVVAGNTQENLTNPKYKCVAQTSLIDTVAK
ncbi:hypothetical protein PGB90_008077 [Kerria lacca]